MSEASDTRNPDSPDDFVEAQETDYEPDAEPAEDEERTLEDEPAELYPDDDRPVPLDDDVN